MLTYDLKAKVADFGLSLLYSSQNVGRHTGVIPYRWSAYEVIEDRLAVIEKSDVWSFGVYVWELFSLCYDAPYTDMTYLEVKEFLLEDSHRLGKPSLCPQFLYDVMLHCWAKLYQYRPTFLELKKQLELFEREERTLENLSSLNPITTGPSLPPRRNRVKYREDQIHYVELSYRTATTNKKTVSAQQKNLITYATVDHEMTKAKNTAV